MSIMATIKARNAAAKQAKGDIEGAIKLYQEAVADGMDEPRYILGYTVLLLRVGEYQKAREQMVKLQKSPKLAADQRNVLLTNYAVCVYRMDELQKGIEVLERQHAKNPCSLIYQTLGYLYIEAGDLKKALALNQEAFDYDDEDPIVLDNLGQTYYRLAHDKEKAKEYFLKALQLRPAQIDTLYFLAQYDLEDGNKDAAREKLETALEGRFSPLNFATPDKVKELLETM